MNSAVLGLVFALLAAFVNGTVGIFANGAADAGIDVGTVAFFKCFIAMLVAGVVLAWRNALASVLAQLLRTPWYAAAGFCGVFVMNTFEIRAYAVQSVATTVLMFLVGAAATTQLLSRLLFSERTTVGRWCALALSITGAWCILRSEVAYAGLWGCVLGMIAGAGYGGYLVIAQKARLPSSIPTIFQVTFWGSVFLLPGYASGGFSVPAWGGLWALVGLALVPTMLGFYFTTLAIEHVEASRVQLYELTEPLFAVTLAWLVLGESMTVAQVVGGSCIVLSILAGDRVDRLLGAWKASGRRA